jgi:hypothetical protein
VKFLADVLGAIRVRNHRRLPKAAILSRQFGGQVHFGLTGVHERHPDGVRSSCNRLVADRSWRNSRACVRRVTMGEGIGPPRLSNRRILTLIFRSGSRGRRNGEA